MSRGRKKSEPRRMDLKKVPELMADQMGLDQEYVHDVISGMRDRFEKEAKRLQERMHERGTDTDEEALRAASEFYIFVYAMRILDNLVEDVDIDDVREAKDELLGRQKKLLN